MTTEELSAHSMASGHSEYSCTVPGSTWICLSLPKYRLPWEGLKTTDKSLPGPASASIPSICHSSLLLPTAFGLQKCVPK